MGLCMTLPSGPYRVIVQHQVKRGRPCYSLAVPTRRGYLLLVLLPFLAILVALHLGTARYSTEALGVQPANLAGASPVGLATPTASSSLGLLLAQVLTVLLATRACGLAVRPLGQPQVIGEMLAGILLGPSLLGLLAPATSAALFPAASLPALRARSCGG
jgi:hypothetical protein